MLEVAWTCSGEGRRPVAKTRSPKSIESSSSTSSSSQSSTSRGTGPVETASIRRTSAFLCNLSCRASSRHSEQQQGGHRDILTSPVLQSISGLCFHSQECPKMSFCLPSVVTANNVLSECF